MDNGCCNCLFNNSKDCPWDGTYHHRNEHGERIGICNTWKESKNNIDYTKVEQVKENFMGRDMEKNDYNFITEQLKYTIYPFVNETNLSIKKLLDFIENQNKEIEALKATIKM